jgi:hypothetical protein
VTLSPYYSIVVGNIVLLVGTASCGFFYLLCLESRGQVPLFTSIKVACVVQVFCSGAACVVGYLV